MKAHPKAEPTPDLLDAALDWAEAGIPVFPTGEDKRPLTRHGHKDASTDPDTIAEMFAEAGARAHGIGGRMGKAAGLLAIDADTYKPGEAGASARAAEFGYNTTPFVVGTHAMPFRRMNAILRARNITGV
jgi:hypothetical protein